MAEFKRENDVHKQRQENKTRSNVLDATIPNRGDHESTHDARQASTKVGDRQYKRKDATCLLNFDGHLHVAKTQVRKEREG
eukprot:10575956-Ditylum_brightwellii.AAC.1